MRVLFSPYPQQHVPLSLSFWRATSWRAERHLTVVWSAISLVANDTELLSMRPSAMSTLEVTWHSFTCFLLQFFVLGFQLVRSLLYFLAINFACDLQIFPLSLWWLIFSVNMTGFAITWETPLGLSEKLFPRRFKWGGTGQTCNLRQWAEINPLSLCCFSQVHCHSAKTRWVSNTLLRRTPNTYRVKAKAPGRRGSPHFPAHWSLYSLFFAVLFRNYEPCLVFPSAGPSVPMGV